MQEIRIPEDQYIRISVGVEVRRLKLERKYWIGGVLE